MEQNFFENNLVMQNIFDHLQDAVYFVGHDGSILFMNKAAENLDGLKFEDVRGKTIMDVYGLTASESPLLRVICNKEPINEHFFRYYINDREVYQICNTFPVQLENGYWGSFSIQRDVTQIKKTIDRNIELQKQLFGLDPAGHSTKGNNSKYYTFDDIVGDHDSLRQCKNLALSAAKGDSPIMLTGLTGTGKELFAQSIHSASKRFRKPFLAINCAAIPESLIEGILFGTVKGVYTGATDRKGLFEEANGGTLFLDEINSMPLSSQTKLLRVLEEKKVQPLGGRKQIPVDVRLISSCNSYPQEIFDRNEIRSDLFYRLAVINILIPPLKERKSDIFLLAHHFISVYNERYGKKVLSIEDEITKFFLDYDWPGNVRQLKYCIECAMNLIGYQETIIKRQHLPYYLQSSSDSGKEETFYKEFQYFDRSEEREDVLRESESDYTRRMLPENENPAPAGGKDGVMKTIREGERKKIIAALEKAGGNVSAAARELNISRQTLVYRMKKYRID